MEAALPFYALKESPAVPPAAHSLARAWSSLKASRAKEWWGSGGYPSRSRSSGAAALSERQNSGRLFQPRLRLSTRTGGATSRTEPPQGGSLQNGRGPCTFVENPATLCRSPLHFFVKPQGPHSAILPEHPVLTVKTVIFISRYHRAKVRQKS